LVTYEPKDGAARRAGERRRAELGEFLKARRARLGPGDRDWEEDIRRLSSLSREFTDLWARHEVADAEPRTLTFQHPQAGTLRLAVSELKVPDMPEARIMVYTPRDADTRARMPLTRRTAAPAQVR
jgi:MmyB-like transcription regulator ligand binding domain